MLTWISGPSMKPYLSPLCTASSQLSVQVYDPVSQCWSTGPAMLSTRGHACCIGVNSSSGLASRVFVIGKRETNQLVSFLSTERIKIAHAHCRGGCGISALQIFFSIFQKTFLEKKFEKKIFSPFLL